MKQLTRKYCTWSGNDRAIEDLIKSSEKCSVIKSSSPKAPIHLWEWSNENCDRLYIDYADTYERKHFLILLDAKSKRVVVHISNSQVQKQSSYLKMYFQHLGYPEC